MRTRELWLLALGLVAACRDSDGQFANALVSLSGAPRRIAGTGDLKEPRFTASHSLYLTVTDSGQPNLVFLVNGANLDWETVSVRPPPASAPSSGFVTPDDDSSRGSVDGTTRFAVFLSQASNLLDPLSGIPFFRDSTQAFVKDLATGENFLVSMGVDGFPANHDVTSAVLSGNGRLVVFATRATNLYVPESPGETPNGASQIYVLDLIGGTLELVTTSDGFAPAAGDSSDPVVTPDGRYVAFVSEAANLVPGDTNPTADVFLYDRATKAMERISEGYVDAGEPALSQDGMIVAFTAIDTGARQVFALDRATDMVEIVSQASGGGESNGDSATPSLSADGRFVAFASEATDIASDDTEGFSDVFVVDRAVAGPTRRASLDMDGIGGGDGDSREPTLSADGVFLAYISDARNVAPDDPERLEGDANGLANLIIVAQPFATP